jgi:predicted aminopeptidase
MKRTGYLAAPLAAAALLGAASCSEVGYYAQCVQGHLGLLARRQPIEAVLADPATAPRLREKLAAVLRIRDFASGELGLPENGSYRCYADLQRPDVVWNVVAAPEFSLLPKQWCFPVAGCVSYRGYYERADAERLAGELRAAGHDVDLYGVDAYSTLGWFDDPVLNTFVDRSEASLAALIFHELAHQRLYIDGDSAFNEAFASAVEQEGVARWLERQGRSQELAAWREGRRRETEFDSLLRATRQRLADLYAAPLSEEQKRAGKAHAFAELEQAYRRLKDEWGGYAGYDRWFEVPPNNARLASVGTYRDHLAAFGELLRRQGGDFPAFYRAAAELGRLPSTERLARLRELEGAAAASLSPGPGGRPL